MMMIIPKQMDKIDSDRQDVRIAKMTQKRKIHILYV